MTERIVCIRCGREGHRSSTCKLPTARSKESLAAAGRKGGLAKRTERIGGLTLRQHQALEMVSRGMGDKAIGAALGISADTAKTHVQDACAAIGGVNRAAACTIAVRAGVL